MLSVPFFVANLGARNNTESNRLFKLYFVDKVRSHAECFILKTNKWTEMFSSMKLILCGHS